jgi:hypothetical protein
MVLVEASGSTVKPNSKLMALAWAALCLSFTFFFRILFEWPDYVSSEDHPIQYGMFLATRVLISGLGIWSAWGLLWPSRPKFFPACLAGGAIVADSIYYLVGARGADHFNSAFILRYPWLSPIESGVIVVIHLSLVATWLLILTEIVKARAREIAPPLGEWGRGNLLKTFVCSACLWLIVCACKYFSWHLHL